MTNAERYSASIVERYAAAEAEWKQITFPDRRIEARCDVCNTFGDCANVAGADGEVHVGLDCDCEVEEGEGFNG